MKGLLAMDNQTTLRQQINNRDVLDTISTPQRVFLGIAAFGGVALVAIAAYCITISRGL